MKEYIDREAAIAYMENHKRVGKEQGFILAADEDAIIKFLKEKCPTTDVVEVVRCKDCKYWVYEDDLGMFCSHWGSTLAEAKAEDFCSYGERKEKE